ncbi:HEAT repeat domain-containing protein [Candidatus Laterigemmans baculatus]|uniref:HEAT repeat domain-containing protein n=1 Tax=Candidatus Laterigemmans baculatus TaxID=2770505 RepID=UPI0013DA7410|nr:HEAT repeat domain-containing protein [Candidatus Laterigemmans baculatus]
MFRFRASPSLCSLLVSALAVALPAPSVAAEATAALRHGGSLSGEIAEYRNEQVRGQLIRVGPGLMLALPEVEFRKIDDDQEVLAEYRRRADAVAETAEAHWELSRWCNAQRLYAQKHRHLRYVLELDPDHGPARQELDYEPTADGWVKRTALRRERGMLRDGGEWRFAEEVSMLRTEKDNELARKNWIRELARLRTQVLRGGHRGAEALQELQAINDPLADTAIARELLSGKPSGLFRREMWIEILARLRTPTAVEALTQTAMNDASPTIRDLCFEHLREYGRYRAIGYFISKLDSKDNRVVRRAGRALIELNDPEIALQLVDALKTKHREVIAPRNDTNVAMTPNGGGGMQMGGKPKVIDRYLNNPEVLTALLEIVPEGVNYQYDQDAWRVYFANRLAPSPGDLRRDP